MAPTGTPYAIHLRLLLAALVLALVSAGLPAPGAAAQPAVTIGQTTPGNVFGQGDTPSFQVSTPADEVTWSVRDYWGEQVAAGRRSVSAGEARLRTPVDTVGYYELNVTAAGGGSAETSFAVLPEATRSGTGAVRYGVQTHFAHGWDPQFVVPLLRKIGVETVRDAQQWQLIETAPGTYDFTVEDGQFEKYMRALERSSIEPLVNFGLYSPHHDGGATPHTDEGRQAFARFVQEVLAHYGPQIRQVGVYNEPNTARFGDFGDGPADARPDYHAELARAVHQAVERARPDVRVVAPEILARPGNFADGLPWLTEYFQAGGADSLDVVSLHPYRTCCAPEGLPADIAQLRQLMRVHGAGEKPVWITELGWPTNGRSEHTTEQAQARYLPRSFVSAFSAGVERFYWYNFMDHNSGPFGLVRPPGDPFGAYTPKPSYVAYAVLTAQLSGASYDGKDRAPDDVYSYRFGEGRTTVRAMWTPQDSRDVRLVTDEPLRVTDAMGVTRTLVPHDGQVSLTLTGDPVYVHGDVEAVRGGHNA